MPEFKQWLENQIPAVLYHHSRPSNRQSILQLGLQTKYDQTMELGQPGVVGGIYLSDKPNYDSKSDVWQVNVSGMPVEEDWTSSPEDTTENWYVVYQSVPPSRLRLLRRLKQQQKSCKISENVGKKFRKGTI